VVNEDYANKDPSPSKTLFRGKVMQVEPARGRDTARSRRGDSLQKNTGI